MAVSHAPVCWERFIRRAAAGGAAARIGARESDNCFSVAAWVRLRIRAAASPYPIASSGWASRSDALTAAVTWRWRSVGGLPRRPPGQGYQGRRGGSETWKVPADPTRLSWCPPASRAGRKSSTIALSTGAKAASTSGATR